MPVEPSSSYADVNLATDGRIARAKVGRDELGTVLYDLPEMQGHLDAFANKMGTAHLSAVLVQGWVM